MTALKATKRPFVVAAISLAIVVFPLPGGPHRMIDWRASRVMASRRGAPGPTTAS